MPKRVLLATPLYPPETGGPATIAKYLVDDVPKEKVVFDLLPFSRVRALPVVIRHVYYMCLLIPRMWKADVVLALDAVSVGFPAVVAYLCVRPFHTMKFVVRFPGDQVWEQGVQRFRVDSLLDAFPRFSLFWHPYLMGMRFMQLFTLCLAQKVIVPSTYLGRVVEKLGVKKQHSILIPNASLGIEPRGESIQERLRTSKKVVLSAGRFVPWKGFLELVEAVKEVNHPQGVVLVILGEGPEKKNIEEAIARHNLCEQIFLLPVVPPETLMRYMETADVFVLNTGYEGFSHTILEAMSVGAAIVTTAIPGNEDLVRHDEEAVLVPHRDIPALRKAITLLLDESTMRTRLMQTAKKTALHYTRANMIKAYTTFFISRL